MSIRKFCRQRRVKESQFYWWQRKLKAGCQERNKPGVQDRAASFALVSEGGMDMPAGLELVLRDGCSRPIPVHALPTHRSFFSTKTGFAKLAASIAGGRLCCDEKGLEHFRLTIPAVRATHGLGLPSCETAKCETIHLVADAQNIEEIDF
jgi:hypothetical protein